MRILMVQISYRAHIPHIPRTSLKEYQMESQKESQMDHRMDWKMYYEM